MRPAIVLLPTRRVHRRFQVAETGMQSALRTAGAAGALIAAGGMCIFLAKAFGMAARPGPRRSAVLELIDGDGAVPDGLDPESVAAARRIARRIGHNQR